MKVIKLVSLAITIVAFILLNALMSQIDLFSSGGEQIAPVMLVIIIALLAAFVVLVVFVLMRLRKMK